MELLIKGLSSPVISETYNITIVNSLTDFYPLGEEWDHLASLCGQHVLSMQHTWLINWLEHFPPKELLVILIRDSHGQLVGGAPFKISRTMYGLARRRLRCVQFIGSEPYLFEGMDILCHPDYPQAEVLHVIAQALKGCRTRWDMVDLRYSFSDIPLQHLQASLQYWTHGSEMLQGSENLFLPLPDNYKDFRSGLKKNMKSNIKLYLNRLKTDYPEHPPRLEVVPASCIGDMVLESLFKGHVAYWKKRGVTSNFTRFPQTRSFYKSLHNAMNSSNNPKCGMELTQLKVGQHTLCRLIGAWQGKHYLAHLVNYNTDFQVYNPGVLHYNALVQYIIERGGTLLDLGRGDEPYKLHWTRQSNLLWNLRVFNTSLAYHHWQCDSGIKTGVTKARELIQRLPH